MEITWIAYHSIERVGDRHISDVASVRYRLLMPASALGQLGYRVNLLQLAPEDHVENVVPRLTGEVVIISKPPLDAETIEKTARLTQQLVQAVQADCRKVVADLSDDHFFRPVFGEYFRALVNEVDLNVASTPMMAEIVRGHTQRPVFVAGDPYEGVRGTVEFRPPSARAQSLLGKVFENVLGGSSRRPLRLLWFGHGSNVGSIAGLLPELPRLVARCTVEVHLVTVQHPDVERLCTSFNEDYAPACTVRLSPWTLDTTWQALRDCDMVIIPIRMDDPSKLVKSPNRLVESVWAGRFVVANPIPSYQEFGDFAWVGEDIVSGIEWALDHPAEVRRRIAAGQAYIEKNFSPAAIARQWDAALKEALNARSAPAPGAALLKLNLGCGDKILPGYVNVDIAESRGNIGPDVLCDLRRLSLFPDNTADEVLSVHVVEHFWRWEVIDILKEWARVLKPGGKMILECPNLRSACQELLREPDVASGAGPEGQRSMWVFYGDPAWRDPLMVHRWGYTPSSLGAAMAEAGLINIRQEPAQFKLREPRDMRMVGEKPAYRASVRGA